MMTPRAFIACVAFYGGHGHFLPEQYCIKHPPEHTNPKAEAGATLFLKRPNLPAKAGKSPPPEKANPPPETYPVPEAAKSFS